MKSYIPGTIAVYHDEKFYKQTAYHMIDVERTKSMTTNMFKVMKAYKYPRGKVVHWILANKSLTKNNIQFLEDEHWKIIGIECQTEEIRACKEDMGADACNLKIMIKKEDRW